MQQKILSQKNHFVNLLFFLLSLSSCNEHEQMKAYQTENVIIAVIDGPRYSDTWGDSTRKMIPNMAGRMSHEGVFFSNFFNLGATVTNPGHAAIATGVKQSIKNQGQELPLYPSLFQLWLEASKSDSTKAWIITSKGKLSVLGNTQDSAYNNKFLPSINCGKNGKGGGNRNDSETLRVVKKVLVEQKPNLMLINFREPDVSGHAGDWPGYLQDIKMADEYVWQLWNFIQQDEHYRDKTTLFITNDHGRHADTHKYGFTAHGDGCESCRHISLLALGPDFKKGETVSEVYEQTDISATIAEMMGFEIPKSDGRIIKEAFKEQ